MREEIAKIISDVINDYLESKSAYFDTHMYADRILSMLNTPTDVVKERKCVCTWVAPLSGECPKCPGTGIITEDVTRDELVEWAKMMIKYFEKHTIHEPRLGGFVLRLKKDE